ncbi:VQ motif-containing protein 31-like [Cornus florida]|uniref:VQ motif-containing protein 31-like n=1 Tax=Cornus florida TaxID=4283 RepID=UPI00289C06C5|nr:VQ motif-containing protein 31-like [Cornus florida]
MEKHSNSTMIAPSSPAPTTFVQADTTTFRELVQKLTGASGDSADKLPVTLPARLSSKPSNSVDATGIRRSPFKLQDRRPSMRKLEIKLGLTSLRNSPPPSHHSPRQTHLVASPIQSPVTPLGCDTVFSARVGAESPSSPAVLEEEKAIAEKGFYLHPSPLSTPMKSEPPELLTLFPLTSPRQQQ